VTQNIVLQGCNNKYGRSTAHARAEPQQQAPRIAVPGIAFGGGEGCLPRPAAQQTLRGGGRRCPALSACAAAATASVRVEMRVACVP
jgi:hypothetical protein